MAIFFQFAVMPLGMHSDGVWDPHQWRHPNSNNSIAEIGMGETPSEYQVFFQMRHILFLFVIPLSLGIH